MKGDSISKDLASLWEFYWEHPLLITFSGFFVIVVILSQISAHQGGGSRNFALERAEKKARAGMAHTMTEREQDEFRRKQESDSAQHRAYVETITELRQSRHSDRDLEIYRYMRRRHQGLGDNYDSLVHDDMIAREAAARFGVSASEAAAIYAKVDVN